MNDAIIEGTITQKWTMVRTAVVIVKQRQRQLDPEHVKLIVASYNSLRFQIQPIVVDEHLVLVDGAHRLQAALEAGWDEIGAMVVSGATEMDRSLLELEANRLRKQMSPAEVHAVWETFGEPLFQARAKKRQAEGGMRGLVTRGVTSLPAELPVTGNTGNWQSEASVSMAQAARETTGLSLDTLNKISDIRNAAEGANVPAQLKQLAQRAMRKLEDPHAKVEPIYQGLQKVNNAIRLQGDPEEARRGVLEKQLGDVLVQVGHLEERLETKGLAQELAEAASFAPLGDENLRTIRMSLAKSLAMVVASECNLTNNPQATLELIGGEVTRLLSKRAVEALQEGADRG